MPPPGTSGTRLVEELTAHDEHAGCAGAADELVRAEEDRVLVGRGVTHAAATLAVHLDVDVGSGCREVPERECPVLVQQCGDGVGVGDDARDVACGREGSDDQRTCGILLQTGSERVEIDVAVEVLGDHHDVGHALTPHDLVGVMLVGADEDDGTLVGLDETAGVPTVLEVRRDAKAENADDLVDGARAPGPCKHDDGLVVTAHGIADLLPSILAQPRRLQSGARALGVRVGIAREHLVADEVLDEGQGAPRGGVVGVGHAAGAVGALHHLVVADHAVADEGQQGVRGGRDRGGVGKHAEQHTAGDAKPDFHNHPVIPNVDRSGPGARGVRRRIGSIA